VFPLGMQGPTAIMKMKMLAPNQQKCKNIQKKTVDGDKVTLIMPMGYVP